MPVDYSQNTEDNHKVTIGDDYSEDLSYSDWMQLQFQESSTKKSQAMSLPLDVSSLSLFVPSTGISITTGACADFCQVSKCNVPRGRTRQQESCPRPSNKKSTKETAEIMTAASDSMEVTTNSSLHQQHMSSNEQVVIDIAVGSLNAAKLDSVRQACQELFSTMQQQKQQQQQQVSIKIHECNAPSTVSSQPMSDHECMDGALSRARYALRTNEQCMYAVGIEGGVQMMVNGMWFESGWVAVVSRYSGEVGYGSSGRYQLSTKIMDRLTKGDKELGDVIGELSGDVKVRHNQGAMGVLTNGYVDRSRAYQHGVHFAFSPFMSGRQYWQ